MAVLFGVFFFGMAFLLTNGLSTLMICIIAAAPTAIIRRFRFPKISVIQTALRLLFIGAAFLIVAYNASRTYSGLWTALAFEGSGAEDNEMLVSEYWYRIFAAPFFQRECYLCGQNCEQWWSKPDFLEATYQSACPVTLSRYFRREVDPIERNIGFTASVVWGLLTIPLWFGIEKGIHHLLLKVFPKR